MFQESDKEQIEQLKRFWHEYGRLLIIAILLGLAAGYGWQYWQKMQHEKNAKAAQLAQEFNSLSTMKQDEASEHKILKELSESYKGHAYTAFAKMTEAVSLIQQEKYDEALGSLDWVSANAASPHLKALANLRKAKVLLSLDRAKESLALLLKLEDSIYAPMAYELEGDSYAALGDAAQAKIAYEKAQAAYAKSGADNLLLNMKASSPIKK